MSYFSKLTLLSSFMFCCMTGLSIADDSLSNFLGGVLKNVAIQILNDTVNPEQQNNQVPKISKDNLDLADDKPEYVPGLDLQPVGSIDLPGCSDIEVIGYSQSNIMDNDALYYIGIRNNGRVARLVSIYYLGGLTVLNNRMEETIQANIPAGVIKSVKLDYSINPPEIVRVEKCL